MSPAILPERLRIKFSATNLDLLALGVLGSSLHEILNQVAVTMYQMSDDEKKKRGEKGDLLHIPTNYDRVDNLVTARIDGIRQGSVVLDVSGLVVASVFSTPGAVSVIHNLFSQLVWTVGARAYRRFGTFARLSTSPTLEKEEESLVKHLLKPVAGRRKLNTRIDRFLDSLSRSSAGGSLRLRADNVELEIIFNGDAKSTPPPKGWNVKPQTEEEDQ